MKIQTKSINIYIFIYFIYCKLIIIMIYAKNALELNLYKYIHYVPDFEIWNL
jgi:hypothetical protein